MFSSTPKNYQTAFEGVILCLFTVTCWEKVDFFQYVVVWSTNRDSSYDYPRKSPLTSSYKGKNCSKGNHGSGNHLQVYSGKSKIGSPMSDFCGYDVPS